MLETFSVKKPFTVFVAVIMVLLLGYISVTGIPVDLLPSISLPYMIVVTPYPGAGPERVEQVVAEPMERALGTVSNVKNVYSVCADNYCITQLEFEDGTDMDSATVKVSGAVTQVGAVLPDDVGTSSILELSMDMIATMYIAVSREGYDIYEMSAFTERSVTPYLERQEGVANVTAVGLVEKSVQVELDADKIRAVNERVLRETTETLDEAGEQLQEAIDQVEEGQRTLEAQERGFGNMIAGGIRDAAEAPLSDVRMRLDEELRASMLILGEIEAGLDEIFSEANRQAATQRVSETRQSLQDAAALLAAAQAGDPAAIMRVTTAAQIALAQMNALADQMEKNAASALQEAPPYEEQLQRLRTASQDLAAGLEEVPGALDGFTATLSALTQGQLDASVAFSTATTQLLQLQQSLSSAQAQYESARSQAMENANIDALVNAQTLSQLIYAQNFAMPAGYLDDADDNSWMLKVGEEYHSAEEIAEAVLIDTEGIGTVRIEDIANVTVIDNADLTYTNLDGETGILLSVYKSSASGTNEVSHACREALRQFEEDNPGTHVVILVDQGSYIDMIVADILRSMVFGALLAILVLALFLRDVRPTIMVAISIPLSVMFTLVLMYFSNLSLNIMTLSGLALGIGMLVDNSIVVMENIIRLRARGVSAATAAVQGTRQVGGAILASTLTTICVFVPMAFTTGTIRSLLIPMALSITYCLSASLVTAMTVIPASASAIMRKTREPKSTVFDRMMNGYERSLRWCLRHKIVTLLVAVALLIFSVAALLRMGIILVPEVASQEIQVNFRTGEGLTREESHQTADAYMERMLQIDGIANIGIMDGGSGAAIFGGGAVAGMGGGGGGNASSGTSGSAYICYVKAKDGLGAAEIGRIKEELEQAAEGLDLRVRVASNNMGDVSALTGSGLSLNIFGLDAQEMQQIASRVAGEIEAIEGFTNVDDGSEELEKAYLLVIDRDKAMSFGLTVAQIYAQIVSRMTTSASNTSIEEGYITMTVTVQNETDPLTLENLMDMEFAEGSAGSAASAFGMGGMSGGMGGMTGGMSGNMSGMTGAGMDSLLSQFAPQDEETEGEEEEEEEEEKETTHKLSEFARLTETTSPGSISRENQVRYITVTAETEPGYNTALLTRQLQGTLDEINASLPNGYSVVTEGEVLQIQEMIDQMSKLMLVAFIFIYLVMVAQFQSLLSPFIILFTIPLAFTGGMLGLLLFGEQLSMLSLMGFLVLMGTVVNNGIVFVDYVNQLRIGGLTRIDALAATGRTRMRPILMTALTTILAMGMMIFGSGMGAQMGRGMAIVIAGGLTYATLMTLYIIPVMYDILYKKQPLNVLVDDNLDGLPDDAAEYLASQAGKRADVSARLHAETSAHLPASGHEEEAICPEDKCADSECPEGCGSAEHGAAVMQEQSAADVEFIEEFRKEEP